MYKIDLDIFKNTFLDIKKTGNVEFKHATNKRFKDLPFVAKDKAVVKDFKGVAGEYLRLVKGKKLESIVEKEEVLKNVLELVACDPKDQYHLKSIINQVYFNELGELSLFSPEALLYINADSSDKKIAQFIYDVLLGSRLPDSEVQAISNVMDNLIYQALPELKEQKETKLEYVAMLPMVKKRFIEDFEYILKDQERIKKYLKPLLVHYYFFYIAQLSIKLNHMFNADLDKVEELFFSVEWEKLSRSRLAYDQGWKKLERNAKKLFSHSKLLEMLNQNDSGNVYAYKDIARDIAGLDGSKFQEEVGEITQIYIEHIKDFDLTKVQMKETYSYELLNQIAYLFDCIDAQFQKPSSRNRAYESYSNWFIMFCKENVLKNRKSLGFTLNLTEEDIIFLTKICIKDQGKVKLKDLFKEFEYRGVFLDVKSKEEIHIYFEKLNLIEKKSDSGDAQYVKGIL